MAVRYLDELEPRRGCGYRRLGKIYVIGAGLSYPCHRLPMNLEPCPVCGSGIKFTRGWIEIQPDKLFGNCNDSKCECKLNKDRWGKCPVCEPPEHGYILWVGEKFYTPKSFIEEASRLGISKAVAYVPKNLEVGKTVVYLAHKKAGRKLVEDKETLTGMKEVEVPAIFYAFVPTRLEVLLKKSEATEEKIESYEKRGIDVVIVPDDYEEMVKKSNEEYRKKRKKKSKKKDEKK